MICNTHLIKFSNCFPVIPLVVYPGQNREVIVHPVKVFVGIIQGDAWDIMRTYFGLIIKASHLSYH